MAGRSRFRKPRWKQAITLPRNTPLDRDRFLKLYVQHVGRHFTRRTGIEVVTFPFDLPTPPGVVRMIPLPAHPECAGHVASDECAAEWNDHLRRLRRRPAVHGHDCPFGMRCAVVPVVWKGRCLAAAKLVCPHQISETEFDQHVEVLDLLTGQFVAALAPRLARWIPAVRSRDPSSPRRAKRRGPAPPGPNAAAHVARAVRFIRQHFHETELKVADIGPALGFKSSDYLAHVFAEHHGQRMQEYLADCRLRHAQWLLIHTRLGIKEVGFKSGFLHAHWFRLLFSKRFGVSPSAFRLAKAPEAENQHHIS